MLRTRSLKESLFTFIFDCHEQEFNNSSQNQERYQTTNQFLTEEHFKLDFKNPNKKKLNNEDELLDNNHKGNCKLLNNNNKNKLVIKANNILLKVKKESIDSSDNEKNRESSRILSDRETNYDSKFNSSNTFKQYNEENEEKQDIPNPTIILKPIVSKFNSILQKKDEKIHEFNNHFKFKEEIKDELNSIKCRN